MPTIGQVLFWLVTLICAAAGAYLGSYLKKKGENLATKEDIAELTRATKEIEAKISHHQAHKRVIGSSCDSTPRLNICQRITWPQPAPSLQIA
jgi:hypothetical protein